MATIAQGQLAGQLAANLTALAAFSSAVQNAQTNGQIVASMSFNIGGSTTTLPLMSGDSTGVLAVMASLATRLNSSWTTQLNAL